MCTAVTPAPLRRDQLSAPKSQCSSTWYRACRGRCPLAFSGHWLCQPLHTRGYALLTHSGQRQAQCSIRVPSQQLQSWWSGCSPTFGSLPSSTVTRAELQVPVLWWGLSVAGGEQDENKTTSSTKRQAGGALQRHPGHPTRILTSHTSRTATCPWSCGLTVLRSRSPASAHLLLPCLGGKSKHRWT